MQRVSSHAGCHGCCNAVWAARNPSASAEARPALGHGRSGERVVALSVGRAVHCSGPPGPELRSGAPVAGIVRGSRRHLEGWVQRISFGKVVLVEVHVVAGAETTAVATSKSRCAEGQKDPGLRSAPRHLLSPVSRQTLSAGWERERKRPGVQVGFAGGPLRGA